VLAESQLVVFGGHYYKGDSAFEYSNDVYVLDVESLTWQRVTCSGEVPEPRYGHSAVLVGSRMFVMGGKGSQGRLFRDMYFLDLIDWKWVPVNATTAGPTPRFEHATLLVGRKIVLHGGWDGNTRCMGDTWVFDTATFTWIQPRISGLPPSPRHGHTLNLLPDGRIVCFGGAGVDNMGVPLYYDDFRQLDPEKMQWSKVRSSGMLPSARMGHTCVLLGNRLVLFGGWGYGGCQCPEEGNKRQGAVTALVFDIAKGKWSTTEHGGRPAQHTYGHTCDTIAGTTMVFYGGWNGHEAVSDLVVMEC